MVRKTKFSGSKLSIKFMYQWFALLKQSDRTCDINYFQLIKKTQTKLKSVQTKTTNFIGKHSVIGLCK